MAGLRVFAIVSMAAYGLIALLGAILMVAMFLAKVSAGGGRRRLGRLVLEDRAVTIIGIVLFLFGLAMFAVGSIVVFY